MNRDFAGKMFGSVSNAIGRYYKLLDGTRVQVVGVVENGKYSVITEDQQPAMFLPFLQSPSSQAYLMVRSHRDPQQLAAAMRSRLRELDSGLPVDTKTWSTLLAVVLFPSRVATMSLGVMGMMGAMLSITGIFGMAAYSVSKRLREFGIRVALGAQRTEVLQAALGTRHQIAGDWFGDRVGPRTSGDAGAGFHRVSGNSPRPARIGWCCARDGAVGAAGHMDSSAARIVGGSDDAAA